MKKTSPRAIHYYLFFLMLIVFIGIYIVYPTYSLLTDDVTIQSTGQISILNINAQGGSVEDIQAAVDLIIAQGGIGNVYIPEGIFNFTITSEKVAGVVIPGGINIIGAGKNKTILRENVAPPSFAPMFQIDGLNGYKTRISGISFIGYPVSSENESWTVGLNIYQASDYRVDHCSFINFTSKAIYAGNPAPYGDNRGVIDHCDFDNPYKDDPNVIGADISGRKLWGYGVIITGRITGALDTIEELLGHYDNLHDIVYVEDCNFTRTRHNIDQNQEAFYVLRFSNVSEPRPEHFSQVETHPSGIGMEIYNNTIRGCEYTWPEPYDPTRWESKGVGMRDGGGVIYHNEFIDQKHAIYLSSCTDLFIWDNILSWDLMPESQSINYVTSSGPIEDVDYYFSQRTGYSPYTYPHPLTIEATP